MNEFLNISIDKEKRIAKIDIDGIIGLPNWYDEDDTEVIRTRTELKKQLKQIENIDVDEIHVSINSVGGDVNHALGMHDILKGHKAKVKTYVQGLTASAATIISQSADEGQRFISKNSMFLVHNVSTLAAGNTNYLEGLIKDLKKFNTLIAAIYSENTGRSVKDHLEDMNVNDGRGEWLSAEEARTKKYVDEIYSPEVATNIFSNIEDLQILNISQIPETMNAEEKNTFLNEIKDMISNFLENFKTKKEETKEDFNAENVFNEMKTELENKISEFETEISDHADTVQGLQNQINEKETELQNLQNQLQEKENEVARLSGKKTETDKTSDDADDNQSGHWLDEAANLMKSEIGL